jgi:hypothetical protein
MRHFKKLGLILAVLTLGLGLGVVGNLLAPAIVHAAQEIGLITGWFGKGSRNNTYQFKITSGNSIGAANLVPGTDNTNALGTSSLRFSNVYGVLGNFSGPITSSAGASVVTSSAPRTAAAVAALYSAYTIPAGTPFLDTTLNVFSVSTGTAQTTIMPIFTGAITSTAPRTASDVAAYYTAYPIPIGTRFQDTTNGVVCVASGTVQTSITVSTGTGACPH